jgi:hypothetical protein
MRIQIVRGRAFEGSDRTGAPVAIVNEAFVRTFWKGLDQIGRPVRRASVTRRRGSRC